MSIDYILINEQKQMAYYLGKFDIGYIKWNSSLEVIKEAIKEAIKDFNIPNGIDKYAEEIYEKISLLLPNVVCVHEDDEGHCKTAYGHFKMIGSRYYDDWLFLGSSEKTYAEFYDFQRGKN